jgi:D-xylose transport system permease protein
MTTVVETTAGTASSGEDTPSGPRSRSETRNWFRRPGGGVLGSLPVILGLVVVTIIFQASSERFLSPQNIFNLSQQIASTGVVALGIVFVLLIGEIDLSAGSVSGVTSAAMVVLNIRFGWNPVVAILVAVAFGAAIGLTHGLISRNSGCRLSCSHSAASWPGRARSC